MMLSAILWRGSPVTYPARLLYKSLRAYKSPKYIGVGYALGTGILGIAINVLREYLALLYQNKE
jgi:hypothetical protein